MPIQMLLQGCVPAIALQQMQKTDCKVTAGLVFAAQAIRGMTGTCPATAPDTLDDTLNETLLLMLNLKMLAKALEVCVL